MTSSGLDDTSDLFRYAATKAIEEPFLLIGAFRDASLTDDHKLHTMMNELNRLRLSENLTLDPLNQENTGALVTALIADGPVSSTVIQLVYEKTKGNPFFIEEIVRSLKEQGLLVIAEGVWVIKETGRVAVPQDRKGPDSREGLQDGQHNCPSPDRGGVGRDGVRTRGAGQSGFHKRGSS